MTDWLAIAACICAWGYGFITGWAAAHSDEPFWRAYVDVVSFRWTALQLELDELSSFQKATFACGLSQIKLFATSGGYLVSGFGGWGYASV